MMTSQAGPHYGQQIYAVGKSLTEAKAAMILIHGRGATAPSILELANELHHPDFAYLAPQAAGNSWYPYSFLTSMAQNEPGLSSALRSVGDLIVQIEDAGIPATRIVLAGFSQGACLVSEFAARNARRYGGVLSFSGGLIGPPGTLRDYSGTLADTPVFLGCSDVDSHIPLARVEETATILADLGAAVNKQIFSGMGHTIVREEIDQANIIVQRIP